MVFILFPNKPGEFALKQQGTNFGTYYTEKMLECSGGLHAYPCFENPEKEDISYCTS